MRGTRRALIVALLLSACRSNPAAEANTRGKGCLAAKDFECARAAFDEAARADPTDAAYPYNLGLALGHLERYDEAEKALQQALTLRPTFGAAQAALDIVREKKKPKAPAAK